MNINCRSILNKTEELEGLLLAYEPDVAVLTETWLHDNIPDKDVITQSHEIIRQDRSSRGGGVAIVIKKGTDYTLVPHHTSTEMVWIRLQTCKHSILIGAVYRPPNSDLGTLETLYDFLNEHKKRYAHVILCGDFNLPKINWESLSTSSTCQHSDLLLDIAFSFNLKQVVVEPSRVTATQAHF